jgi:hypothetical protein
VPRVVTRGAYEWRVEKMNFAGIDRNWPSLDPAAAAQSALECGNTGMSFEMGADDRYIEGNPADARAKFTQFIAELRKRKMVAFVSVVNDWINPRYYGSANTLLQILLDQGPEGIIAQPVGETHTAEGEAFQARAFQRLSKANFKTCFNGQGGRPRSRGSYDYLAWHTGGANGESQAPRGAIEVTDHGQKITWKIDWIGIPHNPARVRTIAKSAKDRGCGFVLYNYTGMADGPAPHGAPLPLDAWREMAAVYGTALAGATGSEVR